MCCWTEPKRIQHHSLNTNTLTIPTIHEEATIQRQLSVTEMQPFVTKSFVTGELNCFSLQRVLLKISPQTAHKDFCLPPFMRWDKFPLCSIAAELISRFHLGKKNPWSRHVKRIFPSHHLTVENPCSCLSNHSLGSISINREPSVHNTFW